MSPYEDLKLISTVTTERHHRHRLSEAHSDWEARAMRSTLFSGTGAQQPDSAADEEEEYVFVASSDVSSAEDAHHDQASAATDPTPSSGTQQPEPANDDDEQKEGRRDDIASPSGRERPEQRVINVAPSDCVARAQRSALSRAAQDLSITSECQSLVEAWASREQSDQGASAGTATSTAATRRLRFLEAPGTFLLAHFVSFLLLTFPPVITGLDILNKTPATLWQLCLYVLTYAICGTLRDLWMAYMSSTNAGTTQQKRAISATHGDCGTAVAAKAARAALVCAVGELAGMTRSFLFMMEQFDFLDDLEFRTEVKSG
ncbi:hypothetical protein GCG54_00007220 [Colletotrichum gloeosporioides]|uniref:Uncharacterized protein n=1 Tax=Colletotrichum gloeosporioides TaxID=474922 RepID=A0A8H4CN13_COLGL|nr:uncharacterized protein GCG54_00007220 [Colletotrichum gloeosporioides]KAF3806968.1 hypothetical protein GCG54_00007220 [Colletotrichum gloeosporioides]